VIYGYIRVSTKEQNEGRQQIALQSYAQEHNFKYDGLYLDKSSGKDFNRLQYQALKNVVAAGDTIIIKELDRLGRNYEEIKRELSELHAHDVKVIILDLPVFNVEDKSLNKLLNSLVIELLSYIAQKEREKIQERVKEGLSRAKSEGVKLGRPRIELPKDFLKYYNMWNEKKINGVEFANLLKVSRATLYRYINLYENKCSTNDIK
jgi:DNA invertase Pin-like site-specific DNA recombinase